MSDMLAVIEPKSDQFNADSLIGGEMTVRIASVDVRAGADQPVTVRLDGEDKVFRPCKTVARIMVAAWGPDSVSYVGKSMRLYRDPEVTWGGMKVGGIRVRAMSHINAPLVIALTEKKGSKKVATIKPLVAEVATIGLSIDDARTLIAEAPDMDTLRKVWTRKDMAPFRAELQSDLNDRKAALEFQPEGRTDADHGDQHDASEEDAA